jgi:hypothetical protein
MVTRVSQTKNLPAYRLPPTNKGVSLQTTYQGYSIPSIQESSIHPPSYQDRDQDRSEAEISEISLEKSWSFSNKEQAMDQEKGAKEVSFIDYPKANPERSQAARSDDYWEGIASPEIRDFDTKVKKNPAFNMLYKQREALVADIAHPADDPSLDGIFHPEPSRPKAIIKPKPVKPGHHFISESESMSNYSGRQSSHGGGASIGSPTVPLQLKVLSMSRQSDASDSQSLSQTSGKVAELREYKKKLEAVKAKVMALVQKPTALLSKQEEDFLRKAKVAIKSGNLDLL